MVEVQNFSYGLLNPGLAYLASCLGCFLGLRCTARARAMQGAARARWLLLAAISIGATGIWVMHFIAMLGFSIPGQTITYNVPVTIGSMVIAVAVVGVGLLIVGFGGEGPGPLLLGGTIIGIGVASMHYMGMWAMRMPDTMGYDMRLLVVSVLIAIVAGTAALWAALRLGSVRHTLLASLIMGVAVSGMHYTGMAAMRVHAPASGGMGMLAMGSGATGIAFLLPLILGLTAVAFVMTAIISLAPTEDELREDAALTERLARMSGEFDRRSADPAGGPRARLPAAGGRPVGLGFISAP